MITSGTPPIQARTIDHVTIVVRNLTQSAAFYTGVLGLGQVPRPDFGYPGLWFQAGSTQIHMNVESAEAGQAGVATEGGSSTSRGFHYAFEVDDCNAAVTRLTELEIPIAAGPQSRPDGARQVYIRDPDGHLIELFSLPK